jgi:hypothetical protein
MWKYEDGPEDGPDEDGPDDVGPAWIDTYEGDEFTGESEKYRDGEWITRTEAQRVATEHGYEFIADG